MSDDDLYALEDALWGWPDVLETEYKGSYIRVTLDRAATGVLNTPLADHGGHILHVTTVPDPLEGEFYVNVGTHPIGGERDE